MPEYEIPSDRMPADGTWAAAGVPGGIPTRSTIHSTITDSGGDQTSEINTAITACTNGQVVKLGPGVFDVTSLIHIPFGKQITLRGTLDEETGERLTTILTTGSQGVQIGTSYAGASTGPVPVMASLTKGATTIEVDDSSYYSVGQLVSLSIENDPSYPIFNVYPMTNRLQFQFVRIASKPDGTHYTIDAPGLHGDYSGAPSAIMRSDENNFWSTGQGLEDLIIDGDPDVMQVGVGFDNSYGSWALNVEVLHAKNYSFKVSGSYRCEVRRCDSGVNAAPEHTTAGHIVTNCSSILLIDNIIRDNPWMIIQQEPNSGNVWAYNLFVDQTRHSSTVLVNHGPWCQYTLLEGNLLPFVHSDGYYGGAGRSTFYRNWMMGTDLDWPTGGGALYLRRAERFANVVGNEFGRTGLGTNLGFGSPNLGNSNDIVPGNTSRMCVAELTTRTSATVGTITAPSGHGVTTGATIDILWTVEESSYHISYVRRSVTVGTVSGDSIPFSGGQGDDLPIATTVMYVPTSNAALFNWWGDWDSTAEAPKEWTGTLTTRSTDTSGVITLDDGQAADFEAQWERAFFGQRGLEWNAMGAAVSIIVTGIVGNDVSFDTSSAAIPAVSTAVRLTPSNFGFQEVDMDVLLTTLLKGNYYALVTSPGVPAVESLGGDTLKDSLIYDSTPQFFTDASIAWPPVVPGSVTQSYEIIPAGYRFVNGDDPPSSGVTIFNGSGSTTFTGSGSVTFA